MRLPVFAEARKRLQAWRTKGMTSTAEIIPLRHRPSFERSLLKRNHALQRMLSGCCRLAHKTDVKRTGWETSVYGRKG